MRDTGARSSISAGGGWATRRVGGVAAWVPRTVLLCGAVVFTAPLRAAEDKSDEMALKALIGTPLCREDADCATVAVGAKACGGPVAWLAWSRRVTDGAKLEALATRDAAAARAALRASGAISNCMFVADPGAHCVIADGQAEGTCQPAAQAFGPR